MAVYAPLFTNVNRKGWPANAIYFDSARVFGTPSYYAQAMLGTHVGDINIGVGGLEGLLNKKLFVNANQLTATGELIIKIVNTEVEQREIKIDLRGMSKPPVSGREIVLTGDDLNSFMYVVRPLSFSVLRLVP